MPQYVKSSHIIGYNIGLFRTKNKLTQDALAA